MQPVDITIQIPSVLTTFNLEYFCQRLKEAHLVILHYFHEKNMSNNIEHCFTCNIKQNKYREEYETSVPKNKVGRL